VSYNNGGFFSPYSEGLFENASVEAFTVSDTFMFAGTDYNGVWRRLRPGVVNMEPQTDIPQSYYLAQNYPNPFNPNTTIQYSIPKSGNVRLGVFNSLGEEVKTLVNGYIEAGIHKINFNASDLTSGIYFYKLYADSFVETKKMIMLK
jgi:hypothetical protein